MAKNLIIRNEVYEYPETGDINYGEEASSWAEAVTSVLTEVSGPGDIPTTQVRLTGTLNAGFVEGEVPRMAFDTSFVQKIEVSGFITRSFNDASRDLVEQFDIKGVVYDNTKMYISVEYTGDDTDLEFDTSGGQITFRYRQFPNDEQVRVKYNAKAIIDEEFFE